MSKQTSSITNSAKRADVLFRSRMQDMADASYSKGIPIYSDFLDMYELSILHSMAGEFAGVHYKMYGGYELAERQMAVFVPEALFCMAETTQNEGFDLGKAYNRQFPITCLEVQPAHKKFAQTLSHRDYLGSILGLGVNRCKVGDILVKENAYGQTMAYVYCCSKIADFFVENLTKVRNTNVKALVCSEPADASIQFKEMKGTVASLRADAVIAFAYNLSRSSTLSLFQGQKVFINGKLTESNSALVKEGDILSVRGYGRFLFEQILSVTKKERFFVLLKKYGN